MIDHKNRHFIAATILLAGISSSAFVACKNGAPADSARVADAATPMPPTPPTYSNRVAQILDTHCTSCHARGGIGPIPLTSFSDAHDYAAQIAKTTREKAMPPWLPDTKACAPLRHSRALTDDEIGALAQWAEDGAPEGTPLPAATPPAPARTFEEVTGAASRVAQPDLAYAPKRAGRPDDYHCFVLDPQITKTERVKALRITPGASAIVHHVILYEVRKSAEARIRALDEAEPGPGYTCFGGIGVDPSVRRGTQPGRPIDFDAQMIVAWAPGGGATDVAGAPTALPAGTAIQLAEGSKLVMQVHYSLDNLQPAMTDRTNVETWFAGDTEVRKQAAWVPLLKYDFDVPKGAGPDDPRATAHAEVDVPFPVTVLGIAPHMHLRGHATRIEAVGDAGRECLLDVPKWDFRHQEAYWLKDGVRVERAALTCQWDNRNNAKDLRWGEGTKDEMCLAFLYATPSL